MVLKKKNDLLVGEIRNAHIFVGAKPIWLKGSVCGFWEGLNVYGSRGVALDIADANYGVQSETCFGEM